MTQELIVDLHTHSHYSRATSKQCTLEELYWWGKIKGINIIGTGDCTHPSWFAEIRDKLEPLDGGLYGLRTDLAELNYVYVALEPHDIQSALAAIRSLGMGGASVSTPYKEEAIKYVDEVDENAAAIGATNAVVNKDGRLIAYNTDWIGAVSALEEHIDLQNQKVALLGAGGAAKAVAYGLKKRGAEVSAFNRTESRGRQFSEQFQVNYGGSLKEVIDFQPDIIVNATSASKNLEDIAMPDKAFNGCKFVMDIVEFEHTNFLDRAVKAGVPTIGGQRMLILQGAETFRLFTGLDAPIDTMARAIN